MLSPSSTERGFGPGATAPASGHAETARGRGAWFWAALWILVAAACLLPAVLNRYPAAFGDVVNYLIAARDFRPTHERAFGYGAFLRATGALVSFWPTAAAQAALAAYLVVRLLSLEAPAWPGRWRWGVAIGLAAVSVAGHLPWQTSFVMPDVFAGVLLLGLLLLAEHWAGMPAAERAFVAAVLVGAAAVHLTHPPLLLGIALAAGVVGFLLPASARRLVGAAAPLRAARRAAVLAAAAAVLGWGALVGANFVTYKEATASRGASVHLFARLQADANAPRILQPFCDGGAGFEICRHLDRLRAERPGVDRFLWGTGGPALLPELGWVPGFLEEARVLNGILLREAWPDWLLASAARTVGQLTDFGLGDGMDREGLGVLPEALVDQGLPDTSAALLSTRQAADRLVPLMPLRLADGVAAAGLVALLGLLASGLARGRPRIWWPALLFLAAWFGNAVLVALGGEVHGRYGSRLVWVAPLLAGVLAMRLAFREAAARTA